MSKNTDEIRLFKHQDELLKQNPDKWLLAWECGTGKTLTGIKLAEQKVERGLAKNVLVICPKSLKDNWYNEIDKWANTPSVFTVMTKEEFRKHFPKKKVGRKTYIGVGDIDLHDVVIVDEAHYFAGQTSHMHKALYTYLSENMVQYIYLLTATPYMSSAWNIWALARLLGYQWNYNDYFRRYFYKVPMGSRFIPKQKSGIENEMARLIYTIGNTVRMDEAVDVPDSVFQLETFDLTSEQRRAIDQIEEPRHIVKWTKVHQICGGTLKGDEYTQDTFYKCEKLSRLKDLCDEHKKVAIVCRYNNELLYLDSLLSKYRRTFIINGSTKNKQEVVDKINNESECVVLINAACSEGYGIPTIPIMIFYSYDFSLKNYIQILGRIQRINSIQKCVYISLVVRNTIDEDVYKCIMAKKDFDIAIYNKS